MEGGKFDGKLAGAAPGCDVAAAAAALLAFLAACMAPNAALALAAAIFAASARATSAFAASGDSLLRGSRSFGTRRMLASDTRSASPSACAVNDSSTSGAGDRLDRFAKNSRVTPEAPKAGPSGTQHAALSSLTVTDNATARGQN